MQLSLCHGNAGDDFLYEVYKEEALLLGICKNKPSDKQVCHGFITFHLLSAAKKKTNKIQEEWFNFFVVENQSNVEKPTTLIPHHKDGEIDHYLGMVSSTVSKICI